MGENEEWEGDEENDPDYNPFDLEVGEYWRDVQELAARKIVYK